MDSYTFYKSLYDRELARRNQLDTAVNTPITLLAIVGTAFIYFLEKTSFTLDINCLSLSDILILVTAVSIVTSIIFLILVFNNMFTGFSYYNLPYNVSLRTYEKESKTYNDHEESEDPIDFEDFIISELTKATDSHIEQNDKRGLNLYRAKTFIVVSFMLIIIQYILITF